MRIASLMFALAGMLPCARATTILKLTLPDMIGKSTQIVLAKVSGSRTAFRGPAIYTYYQLQVLETLKSSGSSSGVSQTFEAAVPGGVANGIRQSVAGAPSLNVGGEYVIFLWTSPSGLTQVIGLSQGLFSVMQDASGNAVLIRPAITGLVLNTSGQVVNDQAVTMSLSDLRSQIQQTLVAGN
jgi:hypothetical protein